MISHNVGNKIVKSCEISSAFVSTERYYVMILSLTSQRLIWREIGGHNRNQELECFYISIRIWIRQKTGPIIRTVLFYLCLE